MKKFDKILVSQKSFDSKEPYDIVYSNITVINRIREEEIQDEQLHNDSLTSYYLDYYLAQYQNGGFSQFVWNTKWSSELNDIIREGLKKIKAEKHLALFNEQCQKVESLDKQVLEQFLNSEYFGENPTREQLKNNAFYDIDESILALNANWLKNHPDLQALSIEDIYLTIEEYLGRKIER